MLDKSEDNYSNNMKIHDFNDSKLMNEIQERLSRALIKRYQFESNLKPAQDYLINFVNSKKSLVIMYADLVGSTNLSMSLPASRTVTIMRSFSFELSNIIHMFGGFVLKYAGDAVIAFFPLSLENKSLVYEQAIRSGYLMIEGVKEGINSALAPYQISELKVKIGIDEGENLIIQYGHDNTSLIDILGYVMNRAAKITSLTLPNKITIGESIYSELSTDFKKNFHEVKFSGEQWKYVDLNTGKLAKLYSS